MLLTPKMVTYRSIISVVRTWETTSRGQSLLARELFRWAVQGRHNSGIGDGQVLRVLGLASFPTSIFRS